MSVHTGEFSLLSLSVALSRSFIPLLFSCLVSLLTCLFLFFSSLFSFLFSPLSSLSSSLSLSFTAHTETRSDRQVTLPTKNGRAPRDPLNQERAINCNETVACAQHWKILPRSMMQWAPASVRPVCYCMQSSLLVALQSLSPLWLLCLLPLGRLFALHLPCHSRPGPHRTAAVACHHWPHARSVCPTVFTMSLACATHLLTPPANIRAFRIQQVVEREDSVRFFACMGAFLPDALFFNAAASIVEYRCLPLLTPFADSC